MTITATGVSELGQNVLKIAERIAERAREASGEQASALWDAANRWAIIYDTVKSRTEVTSGVVVLAIAADERAAEDGYEGPWGAQELVKLAEPKPKPARGPRLVITHLGYVEVPDSFES